MEKIKVSYGKLFTSTLLISAFTFGGGFVIVSLMKKKFVDELQWIQEEEMLDLTAIAQSSPGPVAVNTAVLLGYRLAGPLGALCTIFGTILPPLVILSVVSFFYQAFAANRVVAAVLRGMQAGVAAVILDVVITMGGAIFKKKKVLPVVTMAGAFVATYFLKINVAYIILACGLLGALSGRREAGKRRKEEGQA